MHSSKNDRFVEENVVERVSVIGKHDVIAAIAINFHLGRVDSLLLVNVPIEVL